MYSDKDIIVAPATSPTVRAPLAVIRVSGDGCVALAERCFEGVRNKKLLSWGLA